MSNKMKAWSDPAIAELGIDLTAIAGNSGAAGDGNNATFPTKVPPGQSS